MASGPSVCGFCLGRHVICPKADVKQDYAEPGHLTQVINSGASHAGSRSLGAAWQVAVPPQGPSLAQQHLPRAVLGGHSSCCRHLGPDVHRPVSGSQRVLRVRLPPPCRGPAPTWPAVWFPPMELSAARFPGDKALDGYSKKKYVCKLLFIFLLGHDIDFGHMEAVNLLSSNRYTEKQIVSVAAGGGWGGVAAKEAPGADSC